jgi:hypothetical protein
MMSSRQLFTDLLSAEAGAEARACFDPNDLRRTFFDLRPDVAQTGLDQVAELVGRRSGPAKTGDAEQACGVGHLSAVRGRFTAFSDATALTEDFAALRSKVALEIAPFFMASQHLLHAVCGNWNNEECYALVALRVHAIDVGCGQPRASRIDRYRELLRSLSAAEIGANLLHTATDTRISDGAFAFPSKLMLLGCFPETFAGEILGANLFLRTCGFLPPFELIGRSGDSSPHFLDLGRSPDGGGRGPAELSAEAVRQYVGEVEDRLVRVAVGYNWASSRTEELCDRVLEVLTRWSDPREAVIQLIHRRRHDALQYHEATKINGERISDLLAEDDPSGFVERLATSPFVRPGDPANSALINGLISPQSKMFRIFNRDEISVLERWIGGLPCEAPLGKPPAFQLWRDDPALPASPSCHPGPDAGARTKPRQMYGRLLRTEASSSESAYASEYAQRWLERCAKDLLSGTCALPDQWKPGRLQEWLRERHDASAGQAPASRPEIPPREDVVANVCALAPLTMIDGAWLAGFTHPSLASSDSGYSLFETFFDELGNGIPELNHPTIYRELMRSICEKLPPTHHASYENHCLFKDESFELPVFWLSIGRFPLTYRPEIIGMNLAMELSGVGYGYRNTGRALAAYGLPTTFVNIHNSIDNITSGHTAWAAESIDMFMADLPRREHEKAWFRVRAGFMALRSSNPPKLIDRIKERLRYLF